MSFAGHFVLLCVSVVPPSQHHDDNDEKRRSRADREWTCLADQASIRVASSVLSVKPARSDTARQESLERARAIEREFDVIEATPSDCDGLESHRIAS